MCGIAGVFNYKNGAEEDRSFLQWALHTMQHRGPDSHGTWTDGQGYSAGFVRLAIRDLSPAGNQPMLSACGNYCLSFNGEIYNTADFKNRLQQLRVSFVSTTDTEVLLYALIHWGPQYVLEHFDGIFAFAFFNNNTKQLILARDRAGIKPLYIGRCNQGVVYSSQYDHIINHRFFRNNQIDAGALGAYLCLGYVPESQGIIQNTYLLPHGHYVVVSAEAFNTYNYYDYPLQPRHLPAHCLEAVLKQAVAGQLVSDVEVGTFMSGGVDSPLVSYYARQAQPIQSFTIGVNDAAIDESRDAAAFAQQFDTRHHCHQITEQDLLNTIADNTRAFSEPFADYSSIPTLLLSKCARQQVTVALSGDGGDELFWGYDRNTKMLQQGLQYQKSKWARRLAFGWQKLTRRRRRTVIKKHLEEKDFPGFYYRSLFVTGADYWLPRLFNGKATQSNWLTQLYDNTAALQTDAGSIMNVLRKLEFDIHLQRILIKVDRASMYHSLEVRVPLLSNAMINYSSGLQYTDCIENGSGKMNLKKLLIRHSSHQMVMKPKKGFIIPLGNWIKGALRNDIEKKLLHMPADLAVHFNLAEIKNLLTQHFEGRYDWSWFIWSLYSLVNWNNFHRNKFHD